MVGMPAILTHHPAQHQLDPTLPQPDTQDPLVAVLYSLLFWSNLTPWGRRRIVARRRLVGGERPVQVVEERPVEVVEERPFDDGLP
jgi:hypothetical protein